MFFRVVVVMAVCLVGSLAYGGSPAARVTPLEHAHAHNDYRHARPLEDALDHGFLSVEADIFLVDGKLLVGHSPWELSADKTLERLYLDPLRTRVKANDGRVFAGSPPLSLLVDIKTDGPSTYRALNQLLARYVDMLTTVVDGKLETRAVTVIISGNRPWQLVEPQSPRYAGVDGRLADLDSKRPAHLMPWISDNWSLNFRWQGRGPMGDDDRRKLAAIVAKAHAAGRRVRFWSTPDTPAVWNELLQAGVDLLNTDDLAGLQSFLLKRTPSTPAPTPGGAPSSNTGRPSPSPAGPGVGVPAPR